MFPVFLQVDSSLSEILCCTYLSTESLSPEVLPASETASREVLNIELNRLRQLLRERM